MVELITIIVIAGILAAVAAPRFFSRDTFASRGFYDQVIATLRYAQKAAIAEHRYVCVAIAANSVTLTQGTTAACGSALASPAGAASYSVAAPSGITVGVANFSFNALGQPSFTGTPMSIAVSGYGTPITVEPETGYVH